MILLANLMAGLAGVAKIVLDIYLILILARAVVSWVNADPYNPIVRFIMNASDPLLFWLRRRFRLIYGGMDFSPILVIAIVVFMQSFFVQSLLDYSGQIKAKAVIQGQAR